MRLDIWIRRQTFLLMQMPAALGELRKHLGSLALPYKHGAPCGCMSPLLSDFASCISLGDSWLVARGHSLQQ